MNARLSRIKVLFLKDEHSSTNLILEKDVNIKKGQWGL